MIYKDKVQGLLEVLNGKLRILEGVAAGSLRMTDTEVMRVIQDSKAVTERINELVSIERN